MDKITLDGGLLCLNYVNTIASRFEPVKSDYFLSIFDLIEWSKRVELINDAQVFLLTSEANADKNATAAFFTRAIQLRELIYQIFQDISKKSVIRDSDLAQFNKAFSIYSPYLCIDKTAGGFKRKLDLKGSIFDSMLAPILLDVFDTLLSDKLIRIKQCDSCGWLFYDSSKGGKRRWCSMKSCGSNIKALNWYHKHKQAENT